MKRLQEHTMTKMAVLGKGSMRDKQKVKLELFQGYLYLCICHDKLDDVRDI